jgi:hypothetical protein
MADELPEWPTAGETTDGKSRGITQRIDEFLRVAFNENDLGMGPQVVTKWIVIAEVGFGAGRILRMVDSNLMPWEGKGILEHTRGWFDSDAEYTSIDDDEDEEDA